MSRKRLRARSSDIIARGNNFVNQRTSDPNFLKSTNAVFTIAPLFSLKREGRHRTEGRSQVRGSDDSNSSCGHILHREVRIPRISGNFNGVGARTPPGEKRDPE